MNNVLLWIYLANAAIVIVHEIDSAYWHEWELFRLPGGITGFLLLHIPLVALVLYGLVALAEGERSGLIISLLLAAGGLFALCAHGYFLLKGRREFRKPVSLFILGGAGGFSLVQMVMTVVVMLGG